MISRRVGAPPSYAAAAARTSSRPASIRVAISASVCCDGLLVDQPSAEQLALGRPGQAGVERGLRHADRERADAGPEQVERAHRDAEALVDLAEHVVARDPDAVEVEPCRSRAGRPCRARSPLRPGLSPATANAVTPAPARRAWCGRRRSRRRRRGRWRSRSCAVQRPAVTVRLAPRGRARRRPSRRRARTARTPGRRRRSPTPGSQRSRVGVVAGLEDRVGAEPLQGERGLGLGVDRRPASRGAGTAASRPRRAGLVGVAAEQSAQQAELAQSRPAAG